MAKVLDTPYVHYELQSNLLIATYKKGLKVSLDMAKEIVNARLELTNHKPLLVIVYNQGVVSMDKKARDYLSSNEGVKGIIAAAIVLDSLRILLGNFFYL